MTHRLFGIGAALAAVILAAGLTTAQSPGGPDRGGRGGPMIGRGLAALDLTDDQRAKIAEIHRATRDQVAPLQQQIADLHEKSRTAIADLLTPEQRETMRLMEGPRGGPGRGGPGRPGFGRGRGENRGPGPGSTNPQ